MAGDYKAQIGAKAGLGLCALAEGRTADARDNWFEPLRTTLRVGQDYDAHAAIGLGLARIQQQLGLADLAAAEYQRVLELCEISRDWLKPWRIQALTGLGGVWWHYKDRETAMRFWQRAIDLSLDAPYRLRMANLNIGRARSNPVAAPW